MFERFTAAAREVVRDAVAKGDAVVTPEHLVLALLDREHTTGAAILAHFGVDRERVAETLAAKHRRGGLSEADAEALAKLGIDLDAVVAAVEREHGTGAMAPKRGRRRFHTTFTAEAKRVLERALREALDCRDTFIGDEHVLLALLALGAEADLGLRYTDVRGWITASRRGTGTR
ncbi:MULTISPECIES: Clp protease N-terminal domain-containing protein [Actinokineospora]|uniref:Peptidase n=1 Tax=Actinokineospora fastidiosa TaxID=1816 RepID=A0A918G7L2_9PSEU|nr:MULTISPECIES: Clp protease N-terminal domain-containing protein [Actinokineospora]UVS82377.1 putative ATP-dependent Clp protease ATP-binding subunit [Actinokineospora sp. UTMC 2448]GGS21667.1 peptidase [Actinokineospora fastidiosa]